MAFLFEFVREFSEDLANLAERIENKMFRDPQLVLVEARLYSEHLVKLISKEEEELQEVYPLSHAERIHKLYRQDAIDDEIYKKLEWIRKKGNNAVHNIEEVEAAEAIKVHEILFEISVWYMHVYVTYDFKAPSYKLPAVQEGNFINRKDMDDLIKPYLDKKLDDMRTELLHQLDDIKKEKDKVKEQPKKEKGSILAKTIEISEEIEEIFKKHHFIITNRTKKAAEFQHKDNKEIVYLLPAKKQTTIVLHPDTANRNFKTPDEPSHSTALRRFPKAIKGGKSPTNYGYSYKFDKAHELNDFLAKVSQLELSS